MANKNLFISSICCTIIYFLSYICYKLPSPFILSLQVLSIITSIANHGLTSKFAIYLDRWAIRIISFFFFQIILKIEESYIFSFLLFLAISFYFASKIYSKKYPKNTLHSDGLHIMSHLLGVMVGLRLSHE